MSTRDTYTSLPDAHLGKPVLRVRELARFGSRINRGMKVDVESNVVIVTPTVDLERLRYQEIHLEAGRVNDLLRNGGYPNLLIDLSATCRLDHVSLTALIGFCRAALGRAAFCCIPVDLQQSRWTRKVLGLWPVYASRSEGIQALSTSLGHRPPD